MILQIKTTHQLGAVQKLDEYKTTLWRINLKNGFTHIQLSWETCFLWHMLAHSQQLHHPASCPFRVLPWWKLSGADSADSYNLCLWKRTDKTPGRCLIQPSLSEWILILKTTFCIIHSLALLFALWLSLLTEDEVIFFFNHRDVSSRVLPVLQNHEFS